MNSGRPYSNPEEAQFPLECCSTPMPQVEQPDRFEYLGKDYMPQIHGHPGVACKGGDCQCKCGCSVTLYCMTFTKGICPRCGIFASDKSKHGLPDTSSTEPIE